MKDDRYKCALHIPHAALIGERGVTLQRMVALSLRDAKTQSSIVQHSIA